MSDSDFLDENCENCRFLQRDDRCGNAESVYHLRAMVYRDGDEVVQTGWCDYWSPIPESPAAASGQKTASSR